jgi:hypothetical protein
VRIAVSFSGKSLQLIHRSELKKPEQNIICTINLPQTAALPRSTQIESLQPLAAISSHFFLYAEMPPT